MKLWLISQEVNNDYDTYDSAVVCAETEQDARRQHPNGRDILPVDETTDYYTVHDWAQFKDITAKEIGEANSDQKLGIILASFNAG